MQANLINGPSDSIVLDNGVEITYGELGQEHEEVMIFPGFYFYTFYNVAKELAKKYHVYCIIMRFAGHGPETCIDLTGKNNWNNQWGEDVYKFCVAKGLKKFHYFGKCHGTTPGWYLAKNYPEMLETFCSFTLAPHVYGTEGNSWITSLYEDTPKTIRSAMRKDESFPLKMEEIKALGSDFSSPLINEYGSTIERMWDFDYMALRKFLTEEISVPVCYLFGTADPLWKDFEMGNIWAILNTKNSRTVILDGERHLMECDMPARLAWEVFNFIEWSRLEYK